MLLLINTCKSLKVYALCSHENQAEHLINAYVYFNSITLIICRVGIMSDAANLEPNSTDLESIQICRGPPTDILFISIKL